MTTETKPQLFNPGDLIRPEMGFWLSNDIDQFDDCWRWDIQPDNIELNDPRYRIMKLLDSGHNGLVVSDKVSVVPAELFFGDKLAGFAEHNVHVRELKVLFGKRMVTVTMSDGFRGVPQLPIFNEAWKKVNKSP